MKHTIHNLPQRGPQWLAYRLEHDNASEISAVLGLSRTTTRTELLHAKHTGLGKEFSDWVQRNVLDYGHAVEALVRPLVEAMIGEELYPVTCSNGRLSASLDGMTMSEEIAFECKQWNAEIAAQVADGIMPVQHMPQCQQILMVTGAKKLIFAVGDGTAENLLTLEVMPDPAWFERIKAGWKQFALDLADYVPPVAVIEAVGHTPETLPALRIEVTGMVTASNLADYKAHALAVFGGINRELITDQQFADAEKVVKWCGDVEDRLAAAKQHALSQTESIDALFRAIDDISTEARRTRLELDKLVKSRKELVRGEIVAEGVKAMAEHIAGLNARLGKHYMPAVPADFGGAIKGKRTLDSIRDAVNTTLANAKIDASAIADKIQANLTTLSELASGHAFLFADTALIVQKAPDDLTMLVKSRIAEHQVAEAKKEEEQRERIRAEEQAKLAAVATAQAEKEAQDAIQAAADAVAAHKPATPAASEQVLAMAHIERNGPDSLGSTFPGHPAAGVDVPAGYQRIWTAPEVGVSGVVSLLNQSSPDDAERINLSAINEYFAPIKLDAAGLATLGFEPVATVKASKLYRGGDMAQIRTALMQHLTQLEELQAA